MGVTECDNMLMHVAVSQKMSDKERDAVLPLLATGFKVLSSLSLIDSCEMSMDFMPWFFLLPVYVV